MARIRLLACHQAGEFGYADDGVSTGTFTATDPFPVEIDWRRCADRPRFLP